MITGFLKLLMWTLILQLTGLPAVLAQVSKVGKLATRKPVPKVVYNNDQAQSLLDASILASMQNDPKVNEALATRIHDFLKNPKNAPTLKTPVGQSLIKVESRLVTMLGLKDKLKSCANYKTDKRKLGKRIGDLVSTMTPTENAIQNSEYCVMGPNSFASVKDIIKLQNAMSKEENWIFDNQIGTTGEKKKQLNELGAKLSFERKLYLQSMKNAVKTHIDLGYRYNTAEIGFKAGFVGYSVDQVCPSMKHGGQFLTNPCEDTTRAELQAYGTQYLNNLMASKAKRWTNEEVKTELNGKLKRLNTKTLTKNADGVTTINQIPLLAEQDLKNGVKYLTSAERPPYKVHFENGKVVGADGKLLDTSDVNVRAVWGGSGKAIFVMDAKGGIYISKFQKQGQFQHSSLLAGGDVAAAGELEIRNGVITLITDRSGHYEPPMEMMLQFLIKLRDAGVDISNIKLDILAQSRPVLIK